MNRVQSARSKSRMIGLNWINWMNWRAWCNCVSVATLSTLGACTTISKEHKAANEALPEFLQAKNDLQQTADTKVVAEACQKLEVLWLRLHEPYSTAILAHYLRSCPPSERAGLVMQNIENSPDALPSWLNAPFRSAALAAAERTQNKQSQFKHRLALGRKAKTQREKVQHLEAAQQLAAELGQASDEALVARHLYEIAPRFNPQPSLVNLLDVADDLKNARKFEEARITYWQLINELAKKTKGIQKLEDTDAMTVAAALDGIRQSHKLERDKERFLSSTREWAQYIESIYLERSRKKTPKPTPKSSVPSWEGRHFDAQLALARALWTEHQIDQANAVLSELERKNWNKKNLDELNILRARMAEEANQFEAAVTFLDRTTPSSRMTWLKAWNLRKQKKLVESSKELESLINVSASASAAGSGTGTGTAANTSKERYWLARNQSELGNKELADSQYSWLIENDTLGYYGLLAHREMGRTLAPVNNLEGESELPLDELDPLASWLIRAGETEIASSYLTHLLTKQYSTTLPATQPPSSPPARSRLAILKAYARLGQYQDLFMQIGSLSADEKKALLRDHPDLLFPQPWKEAVLAAATKFSVPAELIFSIMRQESSFNPRARSHADAFGLLQVIPEVAKTASAMTQIPYQQPDDLYHPETNIHLGAAFIRSLLQNWRGQFILAVASYNASEESIQSWIKTRFRGDSTEFIEDIPYEETRNYVKLVMRNYAFYLRLNAKSGEVPFPEECLKNIQPAMM